jgi:hypothetical protein
MGKGSPIDESWIGDCENIVISYSSLCTIFKKFCTTYSAVALKCRATCGLCGKTIIATNGQITAIV